ncbi:hypothetical protein D3C81_334880 [compost metagenome]
MSELVQVRAYTMTQAAFAVFDKLYHKGPQENADLPSNEGMVELISLNLAKKDPKDANRNLLTKLGEHEAAVYFTQVAVAKQQEQVQDKEHPVAEEESFEDGEALDEAEPA